MTPSPPKRQEGRLNGRKRGPQAQQSISAMRNCASSTRENERLLAIELRKVEASLSPDGISFGVTGPLDQRRIRIGTIGPASCLEGQLDPGSFEPNAGNLMNFDRIELSPDVMGGKPCIRGTRVTVGTVVGLLAKGHTQEEILRLYPYVKHEDITQALGYAAWRSEEREVQLKSA